jgi:hypothetical protein
MEASPCRKYNRNPFILIPPTFCASEKWKHPFAESAVWKQQLAESTILP